MKSFLAVACALLICLAAPVSGYFGGTSGWERQSDTAATIHLELVLDAPTYGVTSASVGSFIPAYSSMSWYDWASTSLQPDSSWKLRVTSYDEETETFLGDLWVDGTRGLDYEFGLTYAPPAVVDTFRLPQFSIQSRASVSDGITDASYAGTDAVLINRFTSSDDQYPAGSKSTRFDHPGLPTCVEGKICAIPLAVDLQEPVIEKKYCLGSDCQSTDIFYNYADELLYLDLAAIAKGPTRTLVPYTLTLWEGGQSSFYGQPSTYSDRATIDGLIEVIEAPISEPGPSAVFTGETISTVCSQPHRVAVNHPLTLELVGEVTPLGPAHITTSSQVDLVQTSSSPPEARVTFTSDQQGFQGVIVHISPEGHAATDSCLVSVDFIGVGANFDWVHASQVTFRDQTNWHPTIDGQNWRWTINNQVYQGPQVEVLLDEGEHTVCLQVSGRLDGAKITDSNCQTVSIGSSSSDADNDGIQDAADNCPGTANRNQADSDGDGQGDACDEEPDKPGGQAADQNPAGRDVDNDGIPDVTDNCPFDANPDQANPDADSFGSACDSDRDGDGIPETGAWSDNCPDTPNPVQADSDGDGIGDACDGAKQDSADEAGDRRIHPELDRESPPIGVPVVIAIYGLLSLRGRARDG